MQAGLYLSPARGASQREPCGGLGVQSLRIPGRRGDPVCAVCDTDLRSSQTLGVGSGSCRASSDVPRAPLHAGSWQTSEIPVALTNATEIVRRTGPPALPGLADCEQPAPRSDPASFLDDWS